VLSLGPPISAVRPSDDNATLYPKPANPVGSDGTNFARSWTSDDCAPAEAGRNTRAKAVSNSTRTLEAYRAKGDQRYKD
jgi:hypothetical protein